MSDPRREKRVLYTDQPHRGVNRFNQALKFTQIPMGYPSLALRLGPQVPTTPPRLRIRCALAALTPRLRVDVDGCQVRLFGDTEEVVQRARALLEVCADRRRHIDAHSLGPHVGGPGARLPRGAIGPRG